MMTRKWPGVVLVLFAAAVLSLGVTSSLGASSGVGYVQGATPVGGLSTIQPADNADAYLEAELEMAEVAAVAAEVALAQLTEYAVVTTTTTTLGPTQMSLSRPAVTPAQMRQMAKASFD